MDECIWIVGEWMEGWWVSGGESMNSWMGGWVDRGWLVGGFMEA